MGNKTYIQKNFINKIYKAIELKTSLGTVLDPMIITDEDAVILYANDAMIQRVGYAIDEIVGRTPGELWGNERDEYFYKDMWQTIKTKKQTFVANFTNKRKDGTYYNCDFKIYPVLDDNKNVSFFVGKELNFADSV